MIGRPTSIRPVLTARRAMAGAGAILLALISAGVGLLAAPPAQAQNRLAFPERPRQPMPQVPAQPQGDPQMLVRADRIDYDYSNHRVSAVGNVQIYYQGSSIEADKVIYDQTTKRLHGEGRARLIEPGGRITYGETLNFSDDLRDGFIDSLRAETPDQTRMAAARATRTGGNFTVFESGVYTACEPCKDDPKKPPLWQVKAARIVHDQGDKMIYFENARLEFYGMPLAYLPYFSAPDPTVKRKTGFLTPILSSSKKYGAAAEIPYFWALAPDYDITLSPMLTSRQGPLMKGEWRQRLANGSYSVSAAGIYQLDKSYFLRPDGGPPTPGYRDWRGSIETSGQFALSDKWVWGWAGTLMSDRTFFQDYGLRNYSMTSDPLFLMQTEAVSQMYLIGRGDRSYFDARVINYFGFSEFDIQREIPVIHPVIDHKYTFDGPVLGGELGFRSNFTSLTRQSSDFDPVTVKALNSDVCATADPAIKTSANCLLRGIPGTYTRFSSEATWRRTLIDPIGQMFTPFVSVRGDVAALDVRPDASVSNYIATGESTIGRVMPTVGVEYRYPFISAQSWGTQTIEPIAQLVVRPNETGIGRFPNEDAQSFVFDDTNLFRIDKYSGWDRAEGGGRANVGVQYRAQFDRAGSVGVLFGRSYQLFGVNSFAVGGISNTGLDSGLDTRQSDYVAGATYQPNSSLTFASHFRFDEKDWTVRRLELETTVNLGRWTTTLLYGQYDAQPELGYLTRRQGILGSARLMVNANWALLGAARYDIDAARINQTQIGIGYIDDCLILALNYVTDYSYSGNPTSDQRVMLQIGLRTLGGSSVSQGVGSSGAAATSGTPRPYPALGTP